MKRVDPCHGSLHYGPRAGLPCCNASVADIAACLRARKPKTVPPIIMRPAYNCQTDAAQALKDCCVETSNFIPKSLCQPQDPESECIGYYYYT
jgi:hypothetical protein